jgi:hypothetical protein
MTRADDFDLAGDPRDAAELSDRLHGPQVFASWQATKPDPQSIVDVQRL